MVLIVSSNRDQTTLKVLEYLKEWNIDCLFLHEQNKITNISIHFPSISIEVNHKQKINLSRVHSFWYRKADLLFKQKQNGASLHPAVDKYLQNEWQIIKDYLYQKLGDKKSLGNFSLTQTTNKLVNLLIAKNCDINIPSTIITSTKKALIDFYNCHKSTGIITKNVGENFGARINDTLAYQLGTTKIERQQLDFLADQFYPILAQECLQKAYEIRVFFIKKQFYSMAIFSQRNEKTKIDFRHYDKEVPNRKVPYKLPIELEKKLAKCMAKIGLDTGSIDLVVTKKSAYYFLEVNPVGQFGWLSSTCNYYLEEKIAKYLAHEKNN